MTDYRQNDLFGKKIIKSISFNEQEIIRDILYLHCNSSPIELDATYSIGNFYKKGLIKPIYKFDLIPQLKEVQQSCSTNLPLDNEVVNVMMFDPPFMFGKHGKTDENIKCQDYTDSKTTLTHCFVKKWADEIGFYSKDLFILLSKGAITNKNLTQRHARKYHSYFFVFIKKRKK